MLRYIVYLPCMLVIMMICYITNPIVALFCDECGELKGFLHLWQTWDDTCDAEDWCTDYSPKWMRYNYYEKYTVHRRLDPKISKWVKYVTLKPGATFTIKERFLRYLNRVAWLTRNCAYGWAQFVFGIKAKPINMKNIYHKEDQYGRAKDIYIDQSVKSILFRPFKIYADLAFFHGRLRWNNYIGWKIPIEPTDVDPNKECQSMIANRISIRIVKHKTS